jgi:catechol-2,3-dioxygenase
VATQAVLYTHDLDRLAAFSAECIGLALAERGDGYRQLRADDLVLWLVRGQALAVAQKSWDFAGYRRRDAVDAEGNVIQLLEPLAG